MNIKNSEYDEELPISSNGDMLGLSVYELTRMYNLIIDRKTVPDHLKTVRNTTRHIKEGSILGIYYIGFEDKDVFDAAERNADIDEKQPYPSTETADFSDQ